MTSANTAWVLRGARPLGGGPGDILIRDGLIEGIGGDVPAAGARVIDAAGLIALPGLVDLHTHLREPGREDAETVAS
ncbi:MAG TPA: dihydroorotase, partial [Streptosporangiaceae bacterium]|nr:dihydroorotase [Streptosporangiaceae bacterium]